jgi:hypothetical protein
MAKETFTPEDVQMIASMGPNSPQPPKDNPPPPPPAGDGSDTPPPGGAPPPPDDKNTPPGGAPPPPAGGTPPPGGTTPPTDEDDIIDVRTLTNGKFDDVKLFYDDYTKLQKDLDEAKKNPSFKSDRHKLLYEFGSQMEGMELGQARQMLEIIGLDLQKEPDQRLRFEAFKLDPRNKGLSQDDLSALFMQDELDKFGNPAVENGQTEVQKIRAKQETATAREKLQEMQTKWNAAKTAEPTAEQVAEERRQYRTQVEADLQTFDGLALKMSVDEDGKKVEGNLNFKLMTPEEKSAVVNAVSDPEGWMAKKLHDLGIFDVNNPDAKPNMKKFADFVTQIEFADRLVNLAYSQGRSDKLADELARKRNPEGSNGGGGHTPPPAGGAAKSENQQAIDEAAKAAGLTK